MHKPEDFDRLNDTVRAIELAIEHSGAIPLENRKTFRSVMYTLSVACRERWAATQWGALVLHVVLFIGTLTSALLLYNGTPTSLAFILTGILVYERLYDWVASSIGPRLGIWWKRTDIAERDSAFRAAVDGFGGSGRSVIPMLLYAVNASEAHFINTILAASPTDASATEHA